MFLTKFDLEMNIAKLYSNRSIYAYLMNNGRTNYICVCTKNWLIRARKKAFKHYIDISRNNQFVISFPRMYLGE